MEMNFNSRFDPIINSVYLFVFTLWCVLWIMYSNEEKILACCFIKSRSANKFTCLYLSLLVFSIKNVETPYRNVKADVNENV